jgi:hypothetical protein
MQVIWKLFQKVKWFLPNNDAKAYPLAVTPSSGQDSMRSVVRSLINRKADK